MEITKETQKAGDNSQQIQAENINYYVGITEERARSIFREEFKCAIKEYTDEALEKANDRELRFENNFIPRIINLENAVEQFREPSFQRTLRKAQMAAACTDQESDYKLLTELLICHIEKGQDRINRFGIDQAIDTVDKVDNAALCALTIVHAVNSYVPESEICREGLGALNELFGKLMYFILPDGTDWIDHLDQLGLVRIVNFLHFGKLEEKYINSLNGYVCTGIKRNSDEYNKACELLEKNNMNKNFLIENECLENYVRIPVCEKSKINTIKAVDRYGNKRLLNSKEIHTLEQVWDLYSKNSEDLQTVKNNFTKMLEEYKYLSALRQWWNHLPIGFDMTKAGRILTYTNAKRCDPTLPELTI